MGPGPDPTLDDRTVDDLFAAALAEQWLDEDDYGAGTWASRTLHWRATREIFDRAAALCRSPDDDERRLGIDLIGDLPDMRGRGELGWGEYEGWRSRGYLRESMDVLIAVADPLEPNEDLRYSMVRSLFDRAHPRALEPLLGFLHDEDEDVREELAKALGACQEYPDALDGPRELGEELRMRTHNDRIVGALLELAEDHVGEVRNWSLFSLALLEIDSPTIRDAFADHMDDAHEEAAMEAICGLAALSDPRAIEPLIGLLQDGWGWPALDAAESCANPALLPTLLALRDEDPDQAMLDRAIEACQPR